jgi:hypothetical protein
MDRFYLDDPSSKMGENSTDVGISIRGSHHWRDSSVAMLDTAEALGSDVQRKFANSRWIIGSGERSLRGIIVPTPLVPP